MCALPLQCHRPATMVAKCMCSSPSCSWPVSHGSCCQRAPLQHLPCGPFARTWQLDGCWLTLRHCTVLLCSTAVFRPYSLVLEQLAESTAHKRQQPGQSRFHTTCTGDRATQAPTAACSLPAMSVSSAASPLAFSKSLLMAGNAGRTSAKSCAALSAAGAHRPKSIHVIPSMLCKLHVPGNRLTRLACSLAAKRHDSLRKPCLQAVLQVVQQVRSWGHG